MWQSNPSFWGPKLVKRIFKSTLTIPAGGSGASAGVGIFNLSYTLMLWGGWRSNATVTNHAEDLPMINDITPGFPQIANVSTNSVNATFDRIVNIGFIEFFPEALDGIVQYGQVTMAAGFNSGSYSIPFGVDPTRSAVFYLGCNTTYVGSNYGRAMCNIELTGGGATVTAQRFNTNDDVTVRFAIIQFAVGVLKSRQTVTVTQQAGNTTTDVAITPVILSNTMVAYGGYKLTGSATTAESVLPAVQLMTNGLGVQILRQSTRSTPTTVLGQSKVTLLEFNKQFVCNVVRGVTNVPNNATSAAAGIALPAGCTPSKTVFYHLGNNCQDVIATGETRNNSTVVQQNQVSVILEVGGNSAVVSNDVSWEGIFFR